MLATSSIAFAHVEAEFFLPQVADPSAMTIDGDESDWGWYDRSFAFTPEHFYDASGNDGYTKEDFDFALFMAWSQPPGQSALGFLSRPRRYPDRGRRRSQTLVGRRQSTVDPRH